MRGQARFLMGSEQVPLTTQLLKFLFRQRMSPEKSNGQQRRLETLTQISSFATKRISMVTSNSFKR